MLEAPVLEALALVELESVARGLRAVDALVKRAPVTLHEANLVEPGKFLILFSGGVGEVEESFAAACEVADDRLVEKMLLPVVHPGLVRGHGCDPGRLAMCRQVASLRGALCGCRIPERHVLHAGDRPGAG